MGNLITIVEVVEGVYVVPEIDGRRRTARTMRSAVMDKFGKCCGMMTLHDGSRWLVRFEALGWRKLKRVW